MPHFFQLLQTLDKESTPNGRTFHITRSLKQSLMQRRRSGNRQSTSRRLHQRSVRPTAQPSRNMLSKNSRFLMNECLRFVRYLVNYCTTCNMYHYQQQTSFLFIVSVHYRVPSVMEMFVLSCKFQRPVLSQTGVYNFVQMFVVSFIILTGCNLIFVCHKFSLDCITPEQIMLGLVFDRLIKDYISQFPFEDAD